jgi:hypothetical protein
MQTFLQVLRSYFKKTEINLCCDKFLVSPDTAAVETADSAVMGSCGLDKWQQTAYGVGFKIYYELFLLLPTWYTHFLSIYTNYIKLNFSARFERISPIIRRSKTQIVHMQPLVSSLSASDCLVQLLWKDSFLSGWTRQSLAESDDTRGCICTICVVDLLMMGGMRSKHVEEFNVICVNGQEICVSSW